MTTPHNLDSTSGTRTKNGNPRVRGQKQNQTMVIGLLLIRIMIRKKTLLSSSFMNQVSYHLDSKSIMRQ
jgi:hypothetical protein